MDSTVIVFFDKNMNKTEHTTTFCKKQQPTIGQVDAQKILTQKYNKQTNKHLQPRIRRTKQENKLSN